MSYQTHLEEERELGEYFFGAEIQRILDGARNASEPITDPALLTATATASTSDESSAVTVFAAPSRFNAELSSTAESNFQAPSGHGSAVVMAGNIETGEDLPPRLVDFGHDLQQELSPDSQLSGPESNDLDESDFPWMTPGYAEAVKSWAERGWTKRGVSEQDLVPLKAHRDVSAEPDQVVTGTKRKADIAPAVENTNKRRRGPDTRHNRPKECDSEGRYMDSKVHVIEKRRLKHILPAKEDPIQSPILITYQVRDENGVVDADLEFCEINQIDMQGIGAGIFRCPVPDCEVALVRRHTVERHFLDHASTPEAVGLNWKDHPTCRFYGAYGPKRENYKRNSRLVPGNVVEVQSEDDEIPAPI